jgi:hypothetical protein
MSKRLQLLCVWAGPVFAVAYGICFWGIARFIPPPSPSMDAAHVAALFESHRTQIRLGMLLGMVASFLLFPFFSVISVQIARIEQRHPVLAMMQFGGAVLLEAFFVLCSMVWIVATFRTELDPGSVRLLNDLGWLMFVMVFPGYVMQLSCIAVAAFIDRSDHPVWPRWAGYLNLWIALSGAGGGVAAFFKHGPLAWNGVIGFYVPLSMFAIWICVMTYLMHTGITRQYDGLLVAAQDEAVSVTGAQVVGTGAA